MRRSTRLPVGDQEHRWFFRNLNDLVLSGCQFYATTHQPPPDYPLEILGQPAWMIRQNQLMVHSHPVNVLRVGGRMEVLSASLKLFRAECEMFLIQKELVK